MRRTEYGNKRGERRSFFCTYLTWEAIVKATDDCYSVSTFVNQAIQKKLKDEHPEIYLELEYLNGRMH